MRSQKQHRKIVVTSKKIFLKKEKLIYLTRSFKVIRLT